MKSIFITGASGFVGRFLVNRLLQTTSDCLYLLIRPKKHQSALTRCQELFPKYLDLIGDRIIPIEGELDQPKFGLNEIEFNQLATGIHVIYHTAATIKFDLPYSQAYSINVDGTKHCLLLAQTAGASFERFHHVSTAYVNTLLSVGKGRNYNNTYEQTKHEAERLFKTVNVPFTIYRPSIVSGCSETGELAPTSIIYKFIVLLSRNLLDVIPIDAATSLNFIPVNNFIDKMCSIGSESWSIGNTYPITHHQNTNFTTLLKLVSKLLSVVPPRFIPSSRVDEVPVQIMRRIEVLWPYFSQSQQFDVPSHELNTMIHTPCDNVLGSFHLIIENYLGKMKNKVQC